LKWSFCISVAACGHFWCNWTRSPGIATVVCWLNGAAAGLSLLVFITSAAAGAVGEGGGGFPGLMITIHSAQNLPNWDTFGSIDPYVRVLFGATEQRTRMFKDEMAPVFNETFDISLAGKSKEVVLRLYDWEYIGQNRAVGEIRLPVKWLAENCTLSRQTYGLRSLTDARIIVVKREKTWVASSLTISLKYTPAPRKAGSPAHAAVAAATGCEEAPMAEEIEIKEIDWLGIGLYSLLGLFAGLSFWKTIPVAAGCCLSSRSYTVHVTNPSHLSSLGDVQMGNIQVQGQQRGGGVVYA
jgi:hypothetical protein